MNIVQILSGRKTYLTSVAIIALLFGQWQGWWKIDPAVYTALTAAAIAFLRAGVSKGPSSPDLQPAKSSGSGSPAPLMALAFACFIFVTGSIFFSGCSTTAQQAAYRTAGTTAVSVDAAMKLWGTYVATSHPPVSQEQAVAKAYGQYQQAMANVCDAGEVYSAATQTTNSIYGTPASAGLALQAAVANANQEILDLENLITSFGVNLSQTNAP